MKLIQKKKLYIPKNAAYITFILVLSIYEELNSKLRFF